MSPGPASVVDAYGAHVYGVVEYNAASVLTVLVLAGAAVVVAALLPRRRVLAAAAGVSLAVAVGLTITPVGGWGHLGFETGALHSVVTNLTPHRSALTGWFRNDDGPANVALFAPAGLFLGLLLRRPVLVAVGLTALSFSVECWQATLTTRVGSVDDVVANGLGAALGAATAGVVLVGLALGRRRRGAPAATARPLSPAG